jgi:hypothetical protein
MSSFLIFSISSHPFRPAALCSSSSSRPHVQKELRTRSRDLELMWREPPRCVLSNDPAPSRSHHISSSPRGSNDNRKKLGSLHISTIFPPCFFFRLFFNVLRQTLILVLWRTRVSNFRCVDLLHCRRYWPPLTWRVTGDRTHIFESTYFSTATVNLSDANVTAI